MFFKSVFATLLALASFSSFSSVVSTDELLLNGDFSSGLSDWVIDYGNVKVGKNGFGNYTFASSSSHYAISQYIDLTSLNKKLIDSGGVLFSTSYWQDSHLGKDRGVVRLAFIDENGDKISDSQSASLAPKTWTEQEFSGYIPTGTQSIRYRFIATRYDGSNLDAYFTNSSLNLYTNQENIDANGGLYASDVPVTFSAGIALLSFASIRRKKKD